ncbi:MAG: hypothetical protein MJZ46_05490 [Bacteroidales bacterium]|nr:hypothetical protein [Bacteroidales bacterium]
MKKYTNKILIIAGIIVLIGSFVLTYVTLKKALKDDSYADYTISYSTDDEESTYTDEFTTTMEEENN